MSTQQELSGRPAARHRSDEELKIRRANPSTRLDRLDGRRPLRLRARPHGQGRPPAALPPGSRSQGST